MQFGNQTHIIHGIAEWQQVGQTKETTSKLFTHKAIAYKKYFICLSEIRLPIIGFC